MRKEEGCRSKGCERLRRPRGGESGDENENERWMLARDRSGHVRQHPSPHSFFSAIPVPRYPSPSIASLAFLWLALSFSRSFPLFLLPLAVGVSSHVTRPRSAVFPISGRYRGRSNRKCGSSYGYDSPNL